jgi:hypothetical protein
MDPNSPNYKPGLKEQWLGLNQGGVPEQQLGGGGGVVGGQFRPPNIHPPAPGVQPRQPYQPPTDRFQRPRGIRPPGDFMDPNSLNYKPGLEEQWLGRNGATPQIGDNGFTQALPRPGIFGTQ